MNKKYVLNIGTRILHISGYCHYCIVNKDNSNYKLFSSEDEAIAFSKRPVCLCKTCSKKRDKKL